MSSLFETTYNPDVLSCIANLSSDEVFTPPELANKMLDLLPQEIWSDPNVTFLDPACKTGVFLREIAKRLIKGLEREYPDLQERLDHIYKKQIFGIAITELTSLLSRRSLYCSKYPNSKYSVVHFDNAEGNIRFKGIKHTWRDGRCTYCGAKQSMYDRDETLEQHAYEFIHLADPREVTRMKFDVIVGNPPYQLKDGGNSASAMPIYQKFVEQAKKLNPRFLVMIIPARWYSGGRGLDQFRSEMLGDDRIRVLVDYERFEDAFPGVDVAGGVCYFLWDRDHRGDCSIVNMSSNPDYWIKRRLDAYPVFVRDNRAVEIIEKVRAKHHGRYMDRVVAPSKPFGLRTFYKPTKDGIPCWFIQKYGKQFANPSDVTDTYDLLNKWKLLVPRSPIAGQTDFSKPVKFYYDENTHIAAPGECCTESLIVVYAADTREEIESFRTYLYCRVTRFLLLQAVVSQDVTRTRFCFIPDLGPYSGTYSDSELCKMWNISDSEYAYICSRVGEAIKNNG